MDAAAGGIQDKEGGGSMNEGKIYMTDETGRKICLDYVHNIEITSAEPEGEGISRSFSGSFEATFEAKINQHVLHVITGTESNNERRRHHEPMRRRRKIVYINGVSLGQWRLKKIYKAYTHYGRRKG